MSWIAGIKAFFGISGVTDTAMRIVDKIAGTDLTPKESMDFILKYQESTKHQSPARRLIATVYVFAWIVLLLSWLSSTAYGHYFTAPNALLFAKDVFAFMESNVNVAMNGILAFYFLIGMRK